ncbi:MAG: hypothetical protein IJ131_05740 [Eggerthellaceae bacterium]|nr:hypothetical protein [Eggerthellaceae bacterium]
MRKDEYNWIDDPFDDKQNVKLGGTGMSKGAKTAFVLGMLALAVLVIAVFVLVGVSLLSFAEA